jgi:acyl-CoA synthetase (NDP forming)
LPQVPDLVIVVVPRRFVLPILGQCIDLGVPAALVISAGFAEADELGKQLQEEMALEGHLQRGHFLAVVAGEEEAVRGKLTA